VLIPPAQPGGAPYDDTSISRLAASPMPRYRVTVLCLGVVLRRAV